MYHILVGPIDNIPAINHSTTAMCVSLYFFCLLLLLSSVHRFFRYYRVCKDRGLEKEQLSWLLKFSPNLLDRRTSQVNNEQNGRIDLDT